MGAFFRGVQVVVFGLGFVIFGAWLGISLNHVAPSPESAVADAGWGIKKRPPARLRSRQQAVGDDLEVASGLQYDLHEERLGPEAIRQHDWSADGKFVRPHPRPVWEDYPPTKPLLEILEKWNPDNVTIPYPFKEQLAVFNFSVKEERDMARTYRDAELPFKVYSIPEVDRARGLWNDEYLIEAFDSNKTQMKIERSVNNHFMYWTKKAAIKRTYPEWESPTQIVSGHSFREWLGWARSADATKTTAEAPHHYLMLGTHPLAKVLSSPKGSRVREHFAIRDLSIFAPSNPHGNFFVTNPGANKGIQCRFGMRGVIAEAHYDGGRNMVAMLKGAKRYVLTPPSACKRLEIIKDRQHPSYRHSSADWSDVDQARKSLGEPDAVAIDTVLREGEVLYIPSYWIHYICSLQYSIQCNTRSGSPPKKQGEQHINDCVGGQEKARR